MRVPIACSLTADAATDRIAEWRVAIETAVTDVTRTAPGRVELRLVHDPLGTGRIIELARREKTCCAFFTFRIEIDAQGATLVVEVPEEAVAVLDDFANLRA